MCQYFSGSFKGTRVIFSLINETLDLGIYQSSISC